MKKFNKVLAMLMIFVLTLGFSAVSYAEDTDLTSPDSEFEEEVTEDVDEDVDDEDEEDRSNGKGKSKEMKNAWKLEKQLLEQEKDQLEELKDSLEDQLDDLEAQLETAEEAGDTALIESLRAELEALKVEKDTYKMEMKNKLALMKQIARSKYTEEELSQLQEVYKSFNNQKNMRSIPVENVFFKNRDVKFDTPPVIKEGRTLIPVRAITEAMGATVTWNSEEKLVTIVKDGKTIVFDLLNNITYVNDVEATIDVPAGVMNNRTMVPLRFIAENLGLTVAWDEDAQTIEVDEDNTEDEVIEDTTEEDTTEEDTEVVDSEI
ncbi:conserved exported protein of unknown function [Petrocella atlantisensis]|uniref:Copper amine oxidase-like N-terminal domain-containing protein n=1 Tax=Petrocella atlantisensis TaxID=2173034 RepID=A0A3P7S0M1_9FIRM|nr:copper amine oxidase N-terminal domain-containing protein [Petrocella atlantisensis]VDN48272.1 conserved exported protein of unknown function [Petrocella atlantisensis]